MSGNVLSDREMSRCARPGCGHRLVEHGDATGACYSVVKWGQYCNCMEFVPPQPVHDPVDRVRAKIDQGAPISRDEMHHAVDEAAAKRPSIANAVCRCGHDRLKHIDMHGACFVCAGACTEFRRSPVYDTWIKMQAFAAHRSTEGVTPAEMMEWPEMQALGGQVADPIFDREPRPAPTREEFAAMAVHDALDNINHARLALARKGVAHTEEWADLRRYLEAASDEVCIAARNLPSVTERIAP